ncbi:MAG: dihydrodipicolinate synthase family protein, partial [Chloroflexi bacterium]|nr:dihydrodipicolinate synthase family protein [Chloroflexota bacterium]
LYSQQAVDWGASAVMCLPPTPASASEVRAYFKAISAAVEVPVFIQDTQTTPVPAPLIRRIADECEHVRYAKVESPPQPTQVHAAVETSQGLVTIFGGAGGGYLPEELRRGSQGTMPWPSQADTFVRIWDLWQSGDERAAVELHEREIVPVARLSTAGIRLGHTVHKELLRRRGVIACALVRSPSDPLDPTTQRELDALSDRLGVGTPVG